MLLELAFLNTVIFVVVWGPHGGVPLMRKLISPLLRIHS